MRYRLLLTLWLIVDVMAYIGSFAAAYVLRVGFVLSTDFPMGPYLVAATLSTPLWLLVLATTRTFALGRSQATLRNAAYIAYACLVGTAFFSITYYFLFIRLFSRLLLLEAFAISTLVTLLVHVLMEHILRAALTRKPPQFPTLIVGVTRESRKFLEILVRKKSPLAPVAILDAAGVKDTEIAGVPVLGKLNKLEEVLEKMGITHVIQASDLEQSLNLLSACRARGITYMLLPSVLGIVERDERIESIEGFAATVVSPERSWWKWFVS